jgi:hypothetical protein
MESYTAGPLDTSLSALASGSAKAQHVLWSVTHLKGDEAEGCQNGDQCF